MERAKKNYKDQLRRAVGEIDRLKELHQEQMHDMLKREKDGLEELRRHFLQVEETARRHHG